MKRRIDRLAVAAITVLAFVSPAASADDYPPGFGPNPSLPAPKRALLPTVNIAPAKPWAQGQKPVPAEGFGVTEFASGLDHPRWLATLPNGDVLVAEGNTPALHDENAGLKGVITKKVMKRAGAAGPSADRITLLRDADGDGIAETRTVFIDKLHSPFGMALVGDYLYVANTDAVVRFRYQSGDTQIASPGEKFIDLPAGPINHHWTKNIIASPDGKRLYVTVGSNSNAAENGIDAENGRAAIMEVDIDTRAPRLYATGLRNPNGMAWQPQTGALWTAVNERDELGNELVPDYMTSVKDGGFYGWPYSYYGQHVDDRVKPQRAELVDVAIVPDYALGAHTASLGLAFYDAKAFPQHYWNGAFIGQHGSWNRKPKSGYKVVFVPFENGKPSGPPEDILTGFLGSDGRALGRPVGVAVDHAGGLLVADDVGNTVWRVAPASK
ncbi:PQQ-dependent sugar dehydrogenase [Caballeronia grimmiae]|uniref:Sorbosone dehydrogenase n=1 Tax=Caballeronia grimmiae TaxID=1071679 RepID=A0A069NNI8_9BURK|nr:sorbosone dehydrogenase family protein [Caballeronia grimmiae]KDR29767.1 sorbosone dehydrogenase [Caballeronia grimmiae]GGD66061.1 sorbosone dehydrogenase [Caballeronia grimmiae]